MIPWLVLAGIPAVPLALTALNVLTWRRPAPAAGPLPRVSVLIPARNEAAVIEGSVRAALAEPVAEVLVCDDGSTDGTGAILAGLAREDARLRVISGRALPPGWVGKPHALHQLAGLATGEVLLFVDADTVLAPGAVARLAGVGADVVTALPRQRIGGLGEALVVPLLHLTYTSFLPLALIPVVRDERVLAANGQVLWVRRDAHDRIGGFEAVRAEVVDDMAFCRRAKGLGLAVAFVDGDAIATCRMYGSLAEGVRGFSKNLYEGIGGTLPALIGVLGLYGAAFLLPWVAWPWWPAPAAVGIAANLAQRALLAARFRLPAATVALHVPSILVFGAIAVNSFRWVRAHAVQWRGRTYAARAARETG